MDCALVVTANVPGQDLGGAKRDLLRLENALQPTLGELARLGMLGDAGGLQYVNGLPLPAHRTGSPLVVYDKDGNPAPEAYGVTIQFMCIGQNDQAAVQVNTRADCPTQIFDLRSLVLNLQPYKLDKTRATGVLLDQILISAGGDAYLSGDDVNGELRAQLGSSVPTITNPLKNVVKDETVGLPFILAMSNGYGSSGFSRLVRRDGSQPLTAHWDVGGYNITGIGEVAANTGKFSGNITADGAVIAGTLESRGGIKAAGDISGANLTASGNVSGVNLNASGNVSGVDITGTGVVKGQLGGVFGNFVANVEAALKATSAYISGALTVAGDFTSFGNSFFKGRFTSEGDSRFTGNLTATGKNELEGNTTAYKFRLGNSALLGGTCDPAVETITKATTDLRIGVVSSVKLLVCDQTTSTWVRSQADYASSISGITGSIATINEATGGLDKQVKANREDIDTLKVDVAQLKTETANLATDVTLLKSGVSELQGKVMKWDLLAVAWRSAQCGVVTTSSTTGGVTTQQTRNVCTAQQRVWKKTPFRCDNLDGSVGGKLPEYDGGVNSAGVRWGQNASDIQKSAAGASASPPMFVGLDDTPGDFTVYDVNCGLSSETGDYSGNFWYVGISEKISNEAHGNKCRSGLGSILTPSTATMSTYDGGAYANSNCKNFNVLAPSFNTRLMQARFIVFTNKL